jgi:hypothetical protein
MFECLTTGISYLVSKTIATVINKQIIREKNNPLYGITTQGVQGRISIMADIRNPPRFKVVVATKLTILIIIQAFYLGTTYL